MKIAEQIVQQLIDAGVKRIYGVVGDSLNPIVDAVRASGGSTKGGIDWIHVRHEEAAAFAAGAEAQITGELAVCAGSCGPGNTHLINGLYDANRSHAPVLAIASHIPSVQIGSGFFQETHPDRIFEDASIYNEMVISPEQSPRVFNTAMRHAIARRGVAVITLPGDIPGEDVVAEAPVLGNLRRGTLVPSAETIADVAKRLNKAKNVAIFVGAGVANAHDEVIALADKLQAPIGHSLRGKDFIQYDNPFDVGMTGLLGYGAAAEGMHDADLMLLLGTDFPYNQFLPDVETIQIDTAAEVMGRRATNVSLQVEGDIKATIDLLLPQVKKNRSSKFLKSLLKKHKGIVEEAVGAYAKKPKKKGPIHPEYAASVLDEVAANDAVFTSDTGMCNVWAARYFTPNGKRRFLGSYWHGSMANAMPQAIGAQFVDQKRQVISLSGDGGLSMLLGELLTAKMYELPVNIVVFNNSTLGMVKMEQLEQGFEDYGVDVPAVNYADIAKAMGFYAVRVTDPRELASAYRKAFDHKGPVLVEVITDPEALAIPPEVDKDQMVGFATSMAKIAYNRGAGEAVSIAKSNLRNVKSWRQIL